MIKALVIPLLLFFLLLSFHLFYPQGVEEKKLTLPQKTLVNCKGEEVNLTAFLGEGDLLLLFLHPEIESSKKQLQALEAAFLPLKVYYVAIGNFPAEYLQKALGDLKNWHLLLMDKETVLAKNLDVYSIPTLLLFDETGKLKRRYNGFLTEDELKEEFSTASLSRTGKDNEWDRKKKREGTPPLDKNEALLLYCI